MNYPPDHDECLILFEELRQLDASTGHEFNGRKYEIIHDLAEGQFYEAKPYFVQGLTNPDPDYRWYAISALFTHWRLTEPELISRLIEMALSDEEALVRIIAMSCLGWLSAQIPDAKNVLEQIANDQNEEPDIREIAEKELANIHRYTKGKG